MRYGDNDDNYNAWNVNSNGMLDYNAVDCTNSARPVFYLASDVKIEGSGTTESPFIVNK